MKNATPLISPSRMMYVYISVCAYMCVCACTYPAQIKYLASLFKMRYPVYIHIK